MSDNFFDEHIQKAFDAWLAQTHPAFKVFETGFPVAFKAGWEAALAEKDAEVAERREAMAAVVRALGLGATGLSHAELGPAVASLAARVAELEGEKERLKEKFEAMHRRAQDAERHLAGASKGHSKLDAEIAMLRKREGEAETRLANLPKTADGVPVMPGMTVYKKYEWDEEPCPHLVTSISDFVACGVKDGEQAFHSGQDDCGEGCDDWRPLKEYYSTREAALAAVDQAKGEKQ